MHVEERPINGITNTAGEHSPLSPSAEKGISSGHSSSIKVENGDGVITYKRRKLSKQSPESNLLQGDACQLTEQTVEEQHDITSCHNANQNGAFAGNDRPLLLEDANGSQCVHWINLLEDLLQSPELSEGGIQSCIRAALGSMHVVPDQTSQDKEPMHNHGNGHDSLQPSSKESQKSCSFQNTTKEYRVVSSDGSQKELNDQTHCQAISEQCQNVFLNVIASDKFVSLCSLLCANFHGIKAERIFDFSLIDSRMKSGEYERSSALFASDIQQVWEKFKKIGDEMFHLANSLSSISQTSYQNQVGELVTGTNRGQKYEEMNQVGSEEKVRVNLDATKLFNESYWDPKPDQTETCSLYNISTCGHCGETADGRLSLICDGCEAMYHVTCVKSAIEGIPMKSWYCAKCSAKNKETPDLYRARDQMETPHGDCEVCKRRKDLELGKYGAKHGRGNIATRPCSDSEETSDCRMVAGMIQRGARTTNSRCKLCRAVEEDDKKLCVCTHKQCPYKYYHKSCLRVIDRPSRKTSRWYCPSCLCRGCRIDRDDEKIALCDGCDEGYHTYCMTPPSTYIPKGKWYCIFCKMNDKLKIRRMPGTGESCTKKQTNNARGVAAGSVDMLLSAALKLEEKSSAERTNR